MLKRQCYKCGEFKPSEEFRGRRCKACISILVKKYRDENPKIRAMGVRNASLMGRFGIRHKDYEQMVELQNGVCAICEKPAIPKRKDIKFSLEIDHDHRTGKVRGLLCNNCNLILGSANDSIELLKRSITYLERHL